MEQKKNVYELHALTDVPVIFHHNVVRSRSRFANWHENIEILRFTAGEGTVVCEDTRTHAVAGDLCVIDSGLLHRIESGSEVRYDCLIVDEAFCHSNGLTPDTLTFPRCIQNEELLALYDKVATAFESDDPLRIADLRACTLTFLVALTRGFARPAEGARHSSGAVRTAIGYIRSHYGEDIELNRLAAEVGLSKYHFIRKFKEATGQTVVSYINAVRIEHAERMLREGEHSVAQVAEACGFPNHSYFSKVFARLRGVLPSEILR